MNEKKENRLSATRIGFRGIVIVCGVIIAIATVGGFLGSLHWRLNLLSHFRVQYFVCLAVAVIVLLVLRIRWWALAFTVFALINLVPILPLFFGRDTPPESASSLRAALINVNRWNTQYDLVKQFITEADPDIVVLEEVTAEWMTQLKDAIQKYPYVEACPQDDCFGIAMLSKHPFDRSGIEYIGSAGVPSVFAEIALAGRSVFVLGTHPLPPGRQQYAHYHNEQLAAIPGFLKSVKKPIILLGDLNATPWCPRFRRLLRETGLKDSERGWGLQPTWPSHNLLMRIPIDHCLISPGVAVTHREVGPYVGSDHYPLIVDVRF